MMGTVGKKKCAIMVSEHTLIANSGIHILNFS